MSANLERRVDDVEIRTDSLEKVLGQFLSSVNLVMIQMREDTQSFKKEVRTDNKRLRERMEEVSERMERDTRDFKRDVRADNERLREEIKEVSKRMERDTETFKREVRADTEAFKNQVLADNERLREKIEELSRRMEKETKALKKRIGKEAEKFTKKMGTLIEDMVAPNMTEIARKYFDDHEFDFFAVRIEKRNTDRSARREFDVIAVSDKNFYISEAKSKPKPEDVGGFLKSLETLGDYFPESMDRKVIPIFSTLYVPENIRKHLTRHRIYAMGLREGTMDLLNFEEIKDKL